MGESEDRKQARSSSSLLNASAQFQLAKGCDEVIVGPLVIRQLQVPRTHHHHHFGPRLLSCFSLCQDESQYVSVTLNL